MYTNKLIPLIVISVLIAVAFGCICAPKKFNRRMSYCKADFTVRGKVVQYDGLEKLESSKIMYKKYLIWPSFYRDPGNGANAKSLYIYTPDGKCYCEQPLKVNETYIFNGKYILDKYIFNKCEWNERWRAIPKWAKALLPKLYEFC